MASYYMLVAVLVVSDGTGSSRSEQPVVYELAWAAAAPVLPAELREFIALHEKQLTEAYSPAGELNQGESASEEAAQHRVALDVAARDGDSAERERAATEFPRKWADARRLYDAYELADGGTLPWAIEEVYAELIRSLKEGDDQARIKACGRLLHLAVDAALPFNAVAPTRSSAAGNAAASSDAAERFHGVLIRRLRDQLAYEVRVSPERLRPANDPLESSFTVLMGSHGAAMELQQLDAALIAALGLTDVASALGAADEYLSRMAEASSAILEGRIEAGALLGANLIAGAWIQAGKPSLKPAEEKVAEAAAKDDGPKAVAEGGPAKSQSDTAFMGSLGSTVYHRKTCAHSARIRTENVVGFGTREQAVASGRKPCNVCKPDQEKEPQSKQETK